MILRAALALLAAGLVAAPALAEPAAVAAPTHFYPADEDGEFALRMALAEARASKRLAVVVFGADWCHDSRSLAAVLTSEAFRKEFGEQFEVTFIDVGKPQTGEGRNLDLVAGLGVKGLKSTLALFVLSADGKPVNSAQDAVSWRNADSRGAEKILQWFRALKPKA